MNVSLQDISIRTELKAGDLGHVVLLHGLLYQKEYGYGPAFESYVAGGLHEFHKNYDSTKDRVWICEYKDQFAGFMLLMHRENNSAQLRYFIILPEFRGIGLGAKDRARKRAESEGQSENQNERARLSNAIVRFASA